MQRQSTALAAALTRVYSDRLLDRLGHDRFGDAQLTDACPVCVTSTGGRDVVDIAPELRSVARAGPGDGTIAALIGRDGATRVVSADGSIRAERLRVTDPALLMSAPATLQTSDLPGPPRALTSLPLGPNLAVAVGIDLTASLATQAQHRSRDEVWALATSMLLVLAGVGAAALVEWVARRDRRLSDHRSALTRANAELKVARDRARASSFELETIFTSMSDGVSHFDRDLRLVQWNRRFPDLSGVPVEMLRSGMPVADVLRLQAERGEFGVFPTPEAIEAEVARRMTVLTTTTPLHMIERPRPDGRSIELRRTSLPGGGFVTIYTDITGRKQVEAAREAARAQAERASEDKARFVAIVSHEIRTPLNVTLNALGLIDRGALPPLQRSLVETGLQAGDALLALLNDILDLSRLESGQLAITPAPFGLRSVVMGVADMYRHLARSRGIELSVNFEPGVPERINADAGRIRQMLMNLVSNAAKFADPGRVCIDLSVTGPAPAMLRLAVLDPGPVIAEVDRARLFRPFSQLERATVDSLSVDGLSSHSGSGLGLAICSMLTARMGGVIGSRARAVAGRPAGNEFWIELPLKELIVSDLMINDLVLGADAPPGPADVRPVPRTRVLVVEDLLANQLLLATMLRRDGHEVEIAGSGAAAIEAVVSRTHDIVLMDMMMPGMTGLEATRRIRALSGPSARLAIVGVTANASEADRLACLQAGMTDVITKPIRPAALAAALDFHVWQRRPAGSQAPALRPLDPRRVADLPSADLLLKACLDDLRLQLPELEDAARRGDVALLATAAHAMAGAAGNYGFQVLEERLRWLTRVTSIDPEVAASVGMVAHDLSAAEQATRAMQLIPAE